MAPAPVTSAGPDQGTSDDVALHRALFVAILRAAYSGELAAALAYRGHWRSLWRAHRSDVRAEIRRIEAEEWHHRREVGKVLAEMGSGPQRWREVAMWSVGRFFGSLCFVGGWFGPIYAAGRLEGANVGQYEQAAVHARRAGLDHYLPGLALMTATEDRHERWFGNLIAQHPLLPLTSRLLGWRPPPPLDETDPEGGLSDRRPDDLDGAGATADPAEEQRPDPSR